MQKNKLRQQLRLQGFRLWLLVAILAYTLIGFLLVPWIIKQQLVSFGETRLQRPLGVERVRFNPYSLALTIDGLRLDEADRTPIAALAGFYVNFEASSLWRRAWTFKELRVTQPYVNFVRFEPGDNNFRRLLRTLEETAGPETAQPTENADDGGLARVVLMHFILERGAVDVADLSPETDFKTHVEPIDLEIFSFSTLPNREGEHSFKLVTETGAEIIWTGRLQPNPTRLSGHIEAVGERPRLIWRYIQDRVGYEIADGQVSLSLDLEVTATDDAPAIAVDNIAYTLEDLLIRPKGSEQDVLRIPRLALSGGRLRLPEQTFHLDKARIEGARLVALRDENGVLNLVDLLQPGESVGNTGTAASDPAPDANLELADPSEPIPELAEGEIPSEPETESGMEQANSERRVAGAPDPASSQPARAEAQPESADERGAAIAGGPRTEADATAQNDPQSVAPGAAAEASDWLFTLAELVVQDLGVEFEDRSWSEPLRSGVESLNLTISDFSSAPDTRFRFELDTGISTGGRIASNGEVGLEPQTADLAVDVESLSLEPLKAVIADIVNLRLLSGDVTITGKVNHDASEALRFSGSSRIEELVTEDTILNERFVAWNSLAMPSIELALDGGTLAIETVEFKAPYAKLTVKEDGTTNLSDIFSDGDAAAASTGGATTGADDLTTATTDDASTGSASLKINVGTVAISDGSANFADLSLPLPFATAIHSMKGEIGNIGSEAAEPASVAIVGTVDESGSADINGELNPFAPTEHLKMDVIFKNVHMPRLTPYSAKFAGREIESGKLSLDLKYRIEGGQLDSKNNFIIDQLTLGDKVESPDAMSLPLDLAVALLKDSNGRIDLDLPVTGNINDPEFHYGSAVWKAVGNLLLKAATAPFKLLGALIPGGGNGQKLEFIEFEPGAATLSASETGDLDTIAEAMVKRPQLVLKVPSAYSATTDRQAMQRAILAETVQTRLPAVEASDGASAERLALEQIYIEEFSQTELDNLKAANTRSTTESGGEAQLDEDAYLTSLTRSLQDNQAVSTAELELLADERAQAIIDYLVDSAGVAAGRLTKSPITTVEPNEQGQVQLKFEVDSSSPAPAATQPAPESNDAPTG